ncbi:MAG TPA: DUF1501 domain-containing protein [Fimbriimonadaceae bacterium]|nr:DUF1501 domain-containing protein [Fimbriimonadaceae bacterium]
MKPHNDWWSCDGGGPTPASRRTLLKSAAAGLAALLGGSSALAQVALTGSEKERDGDILVVVFLRGGMDGLNAIVPFGDSAYYGLRPGLGIGGPDSRSRPVSERALDLDGYFGLHPALGPLLPYFKDDQLAIVHAVGSQDRTRSHFEAMNTMERGLDSQSGGTASGWLARHLMAMPPRTGSPMRAVALGSIMPDSLRGGTGAIAIQSLDEFRLEANGRSPEVVERALAELYRTGSDPMTAAGRDTLKVLDAMRKLSPGSYRSEGAPYPNSDLGAGLRQVAMLIKADLGLEVAALDKGGWDTHVAQGTTSGWLASLLEDVASSLHAFASDIGPTMKRVTVVVQTEFGRRAYENSALGTDHGRASCLFVLGGGTRGGRVYGDWPGLADEKLEEGDLRVTTDYRQILAEVLEKRLHNAATERVFPGLSAQPLGIVA